MKKRLGSQTARIDSKPRIVSAVSMVGPKEGRGPLKDYFDIILSDDMNGEESFEKAESNMLYTVITEVIKKSNLTENDIDYLFAGDLLNQITSSSFAARDAKIPFYGLYGACSTMTESLSIAAMIMDGGFADYTIAATSSHFSAAERQFRYPLEYGSQRKPDAQWTVTGAGAMLLARQGDFPYITFVTAGKVKDYGITSPDSMGEAMAPAAVDTIKQHFKDTGRTPQDYDVIATGDLGRVGKKITEDLLKKEYGYDMSNIYMDCGEKIFNCDEQDTNSGGSGCGCSAVVDCGYIYKNMLSGKIKKALLISTGALMSTTSNLQGESIPGIAHAVSIEFGGMKNE
ncbi:stage V sporulation protein AD [Clostridium acetobutylicum]|uniref:Stage V sporulation AD, SpoVAD n=1 Tax=Clostridium acetobutylicum (strain ATCC 824 / DSM 792 / JCM 1419 / IAM 19013 / LMG 5710 / NBRC 13948 / NRRL B-527 / VKM B-1787 / 2291 / W) TaxID=272562 RepID=Q97GR2_CLOAB|nr:MULTISPECIES: stage V sporulation protein AD [Clostridium]AAK80260.1 Stage V sporulation AD, SpoVAD [Clostridium acetobutylicum ATCC 824]ADZ21356.1 stage V sporulation protein AD [Clostridium acetobutylicum EA 2018]AEI34077.1 stage V sporulation protein AD [Clostridium acetobutylicum DSM 1731]AWV79317.1 stage V sporulation protein AD [Clostridium acetobutylicum]MBC2394713.1 stage V sporulation protein AD [Clostridium acetobutylicum]